jgi:5-methylthioadenosine/S-adenosylhomocysteine deaminase
MYNATSHLVYAARGNDVMHSIINGQPVMEDRKLLTLDLAEIIAHAREKSIHVRSWLSS